MRWFLSGLFVFFWTSSVWAQTTGQALNQTLIVENSIAAGQSAQAESQIGLLLQRHPQSLLRPFWVYRLADLKVSNPQKYLSAKDPLLPHFYWWKGILAAPGQCEGSFAKYAQLANQAQVLPVVPESTTIQKRLNCMTSLTLAEREALAQVLAAHRFYWLMPRLTRGFQSPEGLFIQGDAFLQQRKYHQALQAFDALLRQTKGQPNRGPLRKEAIMKAGIAQGKLKNVGQAHQWWAWISNKDEIFYPEVLWEKGQLAEATKQWGQAQTFYTELYTKYAKHPRAGDALWQLLLPQIRGVQLSKIPPLAKRLLQIAPQHEQSQAARYWLARAFEKQGKLAQAKQIFEQMDQGPINDFYTHLARCHRENRDCFKPVYQTLTPKAPQLSFVSPRSELAAIIAAKNPLILKVISPFVSLKPLETELLKSYAYLHTGHYFRSIRTIWRHQTQDKDFLRLMYPLHYPAEMKKNAQQFNLPWGLMAGLTWQESMYKADIRSPAGAVGLMQLMPGTAQGVARQLGKSGFRTSQLTNPAVNIEFGSYYLQQQLKRWKGDLIPTIASYNAGPNAVARWMHRYRQMDRVAFIEQIPYAETRRYVKQVLKHYWVYNSLYEN